MKKIFAMMAIVGIVLSTAAYASSSHPPVYYPIDSSIDGSATEEPGAPVGHHERPAYIASDIGMQTLNTNRFGVIKLGVPRQPAGPGPAAAVSTTQGNLPMNSMLRYQHTEYEDVDADSDLIGATIRAAWNRDWLSIDIAMPIDRMSFDDEFAEYDFTRIGLVVTPRLVLLRQEDKGFDLTFGFNAFYTHTWFNGADAYDDMITTDDLQSGDEEDADHAGIGPMITWMKDFSKCTLGIGALWQRGFNLGGDDEFFDDEDDERKEDITIGKVGMNVGVPIGDRWMLNGLATYHHTFDNHKDLDSDWLKVGLGATYVLNDKWTLDGMVDTDIGADDLDSRWQVSLGAIWSF